jgi:ABC-type phosphate transport system, permease component
MKDKLIFLFTLICTLIIFSPFLWLVLDLIIKGLNTIIAYGIDFLIAEPPLPGDGLGGIGTVLEGTLFMVLIASLISIPISLSTAVYVVMNERSKFAFLFRFLTESLLEFPTIIIGISVFIIFAKGLKLGLNGITAAIALSIIMIPYTTIQAIENMKQSRDKYLETGYALGLSDSNVIKLIVSEGREGVITGILIGMAKIFGETAPLLFTTVTSFNIFLKNLFSPVSAIPVLIFEYAFSPYENWHDVAWGASLTLMFIVIVLFTLTRFLIRRKI